MSEATCSSGGLSSDGEDNSDFRWTVDTADDMFWCDVYTVT